MGKKILGLFGGKNSIDRGEYLDLIPTPVLAIDREFTITYINPAGANVVGKRPEQALGMKCYDLYRTTHCNTPR